MNKQERAFVATVLAFYQKEGRHHLPWRQTTDPYRILVSEIMLQQTQVERVIPKYQAFIKKWPTVRHLARATLKDVLTIWQGLGYNRRAKFLHTCAQVVVRDYRGTFPVTLSGLTALPGIGSYTAGAIMAFAYNEAVPIIETNVRTVYIHHFFNHKTSVSDKDILLQVARTLPAGNAREWYAAVMDYGSHLKRVLPPLHRKSSAYKKQAPFKGSLRAVRGAVVRSLTHTPQTTVTALVKATGEDREKVTTALQSLVKDGLVVVIRNQVTLR